ncbi:TetR/AcrR family transcriptional regulator [Fructobacillus sp. M2-14]|uniref:TetR/AcrR family transcriptional regulator n=1 Tax=Fructobacillus broussonetiae TaxID=2713173 RepID=A0ABS5QZE0_9LACO|nr:TetR/AcrR family transcriptional regulator [Fructobacillus broussonetiae]MBS9338544.1 TetR/AcrR family transcriptional regulator [Fructobacillus broussonetiae]
MANKTFTLMHQHLIESASEAMGSIPFSKLSVKHICEEADVNRNTFYRHFDDKYQLLEVMIRLVMEKATEEIDMEQFRKAPFTTIHNLSFEGTLDILQFQMQDKIFEEQFYNGVFKELTRIATSSDILWLLGNVQVVHIWNNSLNKPYSINKDYKIFDEIIRTRKFPGID